MHSNYLLLVISSLMCAFLLEVYPLQGYWLYWRPNFVLLVVIFWLLHEPFRFGIGVAWICGFALDAVMGGLYGAHALAFTICAYVLQMSMQRVLHFQIWHHAGLVLLLVLVSQLVVLSINLLVREGASKEVIFYPAIASAFFWFPLCAMLNRLHSPTPVQEK